MLKALTTKSLLIITLICFVSCVQYNKGTSTTITEDDYQLAIAASQKSLLILFPCFPCDAANTKEAFDITDIANEKGMSVLMMNYNLHLWMNVDEKKALEDLMLKIITENDLSSENTFIGGFSGGGNVSLLMANYLKKKNSIIDPKGVFMVDSPIDIQGLYINAEKMIVLDEPEEAIAEATWIINSFDKEFGEGDSGLFRQAQISPYTYSNHSIINLMSLKDVSIRLYTEPDTTWWRLNRNTSYEDMNSFYIEQLSIDLKKQYGIDQIKLIQTQNKGYRMNGDRHPHSWSIVDKEDLIDWVVNLSINN